MTQTRTIVLVDKATKSIIGRVVTNHSLSFDDAMELAGFEYVNGEDESGYTAGDGVFYDESAATYIDETDYAEYCEN